MDGHCPARRIETAYHATIESRAKPDNTFRRHGETIRMRRAFSFNWQYIPGANRSSRRVQPRNLAAVVQRKPELAVLVELEMLWTRAVAAIGGERKGKE